jgi:hypothetical protein
LKIDKFCVRVVWLIYSFFFLSEVQSNKRFVLHCLILSK